jgi:hypothetical protein
MKKRKPRKPKNYEGRLTEPLSVPKIACPTCPYRKDTPAGIWATSEYEKLALYDEPDFRDPKCKVDAGTYMPELSTFHCHQENATGKPTVCRGWLSVHRNAVAVRLTCAKGALSVSDIPVDSEPLYYETGAQAAAAGLSGCPKPSPEAKKAINSLERRGVAR